MRVGRPDLALWRYRVGTSRVVCHVNEMDQVVNVLGLSQRREVYS